MRRGLCAECSDSLTSSYLVVTIMMNVFKIHIFPFASACWTALKHAGSVYQYGLAQGMTAESKMNC